VKIYPLKSGKLWIQYAAAKHFQEEEVRMGRPTGVTVIAILEFLVAGFCLLLGLGMILGGGFIASIINQQGQGNAGAASVFAGFGAVLGFVFLVGAAINIAVGIGLLKLKGWARITTIVLAGIGAAFQLLGLLASLAHFSVGNFLYTVVILAIQGFIIWYLLKPEVKAAFQAPQVRAASA
jgi:hypothetical protein